MQASFRNCIALVLSLQISMVSTPLVHAASDLLLQDGKTWVVVASREDLNDAIDIAESLAETFMDVLVVRSDNGWFAVLLGPVTPQVGQSALTNYGLPPDAYLTNGARFVSTEWDALSIFDFD